MGYCRDSRGRQREVWLLVPAAAYEGGTPLGACPATEPWAAHPVAHEAGTA